jgi:hypothetical protein
VLRRPTLERSLEPEAATIARSDSRQDEASMLRYVRDPRTLDARDVIVGETQNVHNIHHRARQIYWRVSRQAWQERTDEMGTSPLPSPRNAAQKSCSLGFNALKYDRLAFKNENL